MSRVGVSIVTFHSDPRLVERAVAHLRAQTVPVGRLRVHANAATSDEVAALARLDAEVSHSTENGGFAGAHNMLAAEHLAAGMDLVVVHNPDVFLAPDALAVLAAAARDRPRALHGPVLERADAAALAPEGVIDTAGIRWTRGARHLDALQRLPLSAAPTVPVRVAGISGALLAVPRAAHDAIVEASGELFDADFLAYREDAELGLRAGLLGIESWVHPAARGLHVRRQRGTSRGADALVDSLGVRNRFLIAAKYGRRRPGGVLGPLARDAVVVAGVLASERSSLPALREAWRMRGRMREKGRRLRAAGASTHGH